MTHARIHLLGLLAGTAVTGLLRAQEVVDVRLLPIKPEAEDFAPVLLDSSFVMCSLRERETDQVVEYTDASTQKRLSDLYRVRFIDGKPGKPFLLGGSLTSEMNDGPATFTKGGDAICFTRNQTRAKKLGNVNARNDRLGLFFAQREHGDWSAPEPFEYNSTEHSVMHASYSADGQRLYFASDMPGGLGGVDLYVCEKEDGGWTIPLNLGPQVNSAANEVFPFIQRNGVLYFASDREGGLGGLDIWSCTSEGGKWSAATPLPEPFNSPGNDLGYTAWPTDRAGLFSSDRTGEDRIYKFNRTLAPFADCAPQQQNNYCYVFQEEASIDADTLPLRYQWDLGDGTKVTALEARHCYAGPGAYTVKLNIIDTLTNSIFFNEATYDLLIDDVHQPYITTVDTARTGRPVQLDAFHTYLPEMQVEDWRWDMGDGTLEEGMRAEHSWKAPGTYTVRLDAIGLPDSTGGIPHRCVTRTIEVIDRFKDVADDAVLAVYKDSKGITREFTYQDLPFDRFDMAAQENEDVHFTVELFHSTERLSLEDPRFAEIRKFFPVYERFDPVRGEYTYSVGGAETVADMYLIYKKVKELQFLEAEVIALHEEKLTDMSELALLSVEELNNTVVRASTVLFGYDRSTFDAEFERSLQKIKDLLYEHADLRVVIEAHTDSKGKNDYNLKLSQKRAQSIVDWLVAHGVEKDRMTPVGFGEDHPIASNENEIGRGRNRRVEFRLAMDKQDQANLRRR